MDELQSSDFRENPDRLHEDFLGDVKKILKTTLQTTSSFSQANNLSNIISNKIESNINKNQQYCIWLKRVKCLLSLCRINELQIKSEQPDMSNSILLMKGIFIFFILSKVRPCAFFKKLVSTEGQKGKVKISDELRKDVKEMIYQMYIIEKILGHMFLRRNAPSALILFLLIDLKYSII